MGKKSRDTADQKAWYFYDWANSAYVTTVTTVLYGPYLTSVAEDAAGCGGADTCSASLNVLGLNVSPGSLFFYVVTLSTLLSAFLLPLMGAYADLRHDKQKLLGHLAWVGAVATALMFFVADGNWILGSVLLMVGNLALGASLVVYDAILCDITPPDDRDRVSSRGWALGYVGGGFLLVLNLGFYLSASEAFAEMAVRISLLSAGLWWGLWTLIPYYKIKNRKDHVTTEIHVGKLAAGSFGQLKTTFKELSKYPQTRMFLLAYLFFNDGVQTVIASASIYGTEELGLQSESMIVAIVIVQIVAIAGALFTGRLAGSIGAYKTIYYSLSVWIVVIIAGYFLPAGKATLFFILAAAIGFVLGGTQALSRSLFSQLVPRAREAEYFALYQACERGTSWLGTLTFGLVHQITGSYRPAIIALVIFFVVGGYFLRKVDVRTGIKDAGNQQPALV
jgi:UMF1 family MFS transporter